MEKRTILLNEYKTAIEHLSKTRTSFAFQNSGPAHASIVISTIFKNAENAVRIYANNINGVISDIGDYLESVERYIKKGKEFMLIVKNEVPPNSNLLKLLKDLSVNYPNITVKKANKEFVSSIKNLYNKEVFFVVGDKASYRLELDNSTHVATCNFNDESIASLLVNAFDKHYKACPNLF